MWVGIRGMLGKQEGEVETGITALKTQNGKMVSPTGKRQVLQ